MFKSEPFYPRVKSTAANFKVYEVKEASILLYGTGDYVRYHLVVYGNEVSSGILFWRKLYFWAYVADDVVNTYLPLYGVYGIILHAMTKMIYE